MFDMSYESPKTRKIVTIRFFAWVEWPLELLELAGRELKYAILKASNVEHIRLTRTCNKYGLYRYEGDELKCIKEKTSVVFPVRDVMEFVTDADFERYSRERWQHLKTQ